MYMAGIAVVIILLIAYWNWGSAAGGADEAGGTGCAADDSADDGADEPAGYDVEAAVDSLRKKQSQLVS